MQPIKLLYYALLGGQVLFAAVVVLVINSNDSGNAQGLDMFRYGVPLMTFGSVTAALLMSRSRREQLEAVKDPEEKLAQYRMTVILRSAMIEGANLFALIGTLLGGGTGYLMYFAVGLLAFLYLRPTDNFA